MHVTSLCQGRRRSMRPPLAAVLMLALAGVGGLANAAGFDEKVKAPMMKSNAQTHAQAKEFGVRYREVRANAPARMISDASLAREKFDLRWQLERAIDDRKPIDEFTELGFVSLGNGSYKVDFNEHPEWGDFHTGILGVLIGANLDSSAPALIERGFRPEDVHKLKDYVATHDPKMASKAAVLPISLGFARTVRKFDKGKRPVPDALVLSYVYQSARAVSESNRLWVDTLLKQFDTQRVRILMSTFLEFQSSGEWHPTDPALVIADQLNTVRIPNFDELATADAKGVAP